MSAKFSIFQERLKIFVLASLFLFTACTRDGRQTAPSENPKLGQTSHAPARPIDPGLFSAQGNGEGYSGPEFVFPLLLGKRTSPPTDAFHTCLSEGPIDRRGTISLVLRLLGQIYGKDPGERVRDLAANPSLIKGNFILFPYPAVHLKSEIVGIEINASGEIMNLKPPFSVLTEIEFIDPITLSPRRLRLPRLPRNTGLLRQTLKAQGHSVDAAVYQFDPLSERAPVQEILMSGESKPSEFFVNTVDFVNCLQSESQILVAESNKGTIVTEPSDRIDLMDWWLKRFTGRFITESGRMIEINKDRSIRVSLKEDDFALEGVVTEVYANLPKSSHIDRHNPDSTSGFRVKIDWKFSDIPNDPEKIWFGSGTSYGITERQQKRHFDSEWRALAIDQDHWQLVGQSEWRKTLSRLNLASLPVGVPRSKTRGLQQCPDLEPWISQRWTDSVVTGDNLQERQRRDLEEVKNREIVAQRLFRKFWQGQGLDLKLFDRCLTGNSEKQNFLSTLNRVFWDETRTYLTSLGQKKAMPRLKQFLAQLESSPDLPILRSFRLTGHRASLSDNERMAGVDHRQQSVFMNPSQMSPQEWTMTWLHEHSHVLDRNLKLSASQAQSHLENLGAKDLGDKFQEKEMANWIEKSLEATLVAEERAWEETFAIYLEIRSEVTTWKVERLEKALSFQGEGEDLMAYTKRLLGTLNLPVSKEIATTLIQEALRLSGLSLTEVPAPVVEKLPLRGTLDHFD